MNAEEETGPGSREAEACDAEAEAVRKGFAALPFDKKIATLLKVEFDMIGEAVETVVNAASRVADDIADAVSGTGRAETDSARNDAPST